MQIDIMFIAIAITICLIFVIIKQQRTIDRLTDKLMARNYVEYKSMNGVKEEYASPNREDDEPKSWHDH